MEELTSRVLSVHVLFVETVLVVFLDLLFFVLRFVFVFASFVKVDGASANFENELGSQPLLCYFWVARPWNHDDV